jgi:hypothetical protein
MPPLIASNSAVAISLAIVMGSQHLIVSVAPTRSVRRPILLCARPPVSRRKRTSASSGMSQ